MAILLVTAVVTGLLVGRSDAGPGDRADGRGSDVVNRGRTLYRTGCSSCHGLDGRGVRGSGDNERGPSLRGAGEASAYYMLSTGRMPLNDPNDQPRHRRPAYGDRDIAALVAYVASIGDGPKLPDLPRRTDLASGGQVFRGNCQACHSASGSGGALSYGRAAPALNEATPKQIAAAVRSGPGQMPVFSASEVTDQQLADTVRYVEYLRAPEDPGGLPLGRIGPVPEGFVAWAVGIPLLLASVVWIGTRSPIIRRRRP